MSTTTNSSGPVLTFLNETIDSIQTSLKNNNLDKVKALTKREPKSNNIKAVNKLEKLTLSQNIALKLIKERAKPNQRKNTTATTMISLKHLVAGQKKL